ncbi:phage protein YjhS encoded within prophage CP-933O [Escherichia coli]|nr:phage protein YjhS encoded within prophage CP-933O [Escherichia coli]
MGEFGNYSKRLADAGAGVHRRQCHGYSETEWSGWPAFQVIKDSLTLGLHALTLTDITKNAAYGVDIGSLVLESIIPQHKEEQESKQMLKTNSLRESMLHGCRWCQANPRIHHFRGERQH